MTEIRVPETVGPSASGKTTIMGTLVDEEKAQAVVQENYAKLLKLLD